jgi:hypothetical protein
MSSPLEELAVSSAVAMANLPAEESDCLTKIGSNAIKLFRLYTYPESREQYRQPPQIAQQYLQQNPNQQSQDSSAWSWFKNLTSAATKPDSQARSHGKHGHGGHGGHGHSHSHGPHAGQSHHAFVGSQSGGLGAEAHHAGAGQGSANHGLQGVFGGGVAHQAAHSIGQGHEGAGSLAQEHSYGIDKKGHWDMGVDYGFHFNKKKQAQVEHSEESSWACVDNAYNFYRKIAAFDIYSFFDFNKRHEGNHSGVHEHGATVAGEHNHGYYVN